MGGVGQAAHVATYSAAEPLATVCVNGAFALSDVAASGNGSLNWIEVYATKPAARIYILIQGFLEMPYRLRHQATQLVKYKTPFSTPPKLSSIKYFAPILPGTKTIL